MRIEELHDKLFDLLCRIDDICNDNNIRYFLDSGTELGAVREKNFIPWDDDMDIKILGEDFDVFMTTMRSKLPEHLHIVEPDIFSPGFYDFIIRIYDDRWLIRKETEEDIFYGNIQNHVGTDVFVFSKAPDNSLLRNFMIFKIKVLYGMGMAFRFKVKDEKYTLLQKLEVCVLRTLGKFTSPNKIYEQYKKVIFKYNSLPNCRYRIPVNFSLTNIKEYRDEWYDQSTYGEMRRRKFPIPGGFDAELTNAYGNYMEPLKNKTAFRSHLDQGDNDMLQ